MRSRPCAASQSLRAISVSPGTAGAPPTTMRMGSPSVW
jgi:hypothetical protein